MSAKALQKAESQQKIQVALEPNFLQEHHSAHLKTCQNLLCGFNYRAILVKLVTSFAPVAQYLLFSERNIPLDPTMKTNFPW